MLDELIKNIIKETVTITIQMMEDSNINKTYIPEVMNVKQLAEYIGMSTQWVYEHVKELPHEKRGRKLIFTRIEIDNWRQLQREKKEYYQKSIMVPNINKKHKVT